MTTTKRTRSVKTASARQSRSKETPKRAAMFFRTHALPDMQLGERLPATSLKIHGASTGRAIGICADGHIETHR
jgi:hypothetical protein